MLVTSISLCDICLLLCPIMSYYALLCPIMPSILIICTTHLYLYLNVNINNNHISKYTNHRYLSFTIVTIDEQKGKKLLENSLTKTELLALGNLTMEVIIYIYIYIYI